MHNRNEVAIRSFNKVPDFSGSYRERAGKVYWFVSILFTHLPGLLIIIWNTWDCRIKLVN
jgi:hypothetical protein